MTTIERNKCKDRFIIIPICIYIIAMYTVGTISSFTMSWSYTIAFLGLTAFLMFFRNTKIVINTVSGAWIVVTLICFVSSALVMDFRDSAFYLLSGVFIVACCTASSYNLYNSFYFLILGAMLFLAGILIQFFWPSFYDSTIYPLFPAIYRTDIIRQYYAHKMYTGFSSEASISAQFMMMGIVALYCLYPNLRQKRKKYAYVLGLILFAGVILTGKRSSFLFFIAALIYTYMKSATRKQKSERVLKLLFVAALILIASYYFLPYFIEHSSSRNSLVRLIELSNDDDVSNGRFQLWRQAIEAFYESPIFGKGWGWYYSVYDTGAHNIYLQLLCECGLIGAVVVYVILGYFFVKCQKKLRLALMRKDALQVSLLKFCLFTQTYMLLYGFTGNPLYNYSFLIWYAFSVCILTNVCKRKSWSESHRIIV